MIKTHPEKRLIGLIEVFYPTRHRGAARHCQKRPSRIPARWP